MVPQSVSRPRDARIEGVVHPNGCCTPSSPRPTPRPPCTERPEATARKETTRSDDPVHDSFDLPLNVSARTVLTPAVLAERGLTRHQVTKLVASGRLVRLRRGRLASADMHPSLMRAGRLGGRLDCVSLLKELGVFVRPRDGRLHVQLDMGASRLPARDSGVRAHWRPTVAARDVLTADLVEALAQACRCQTPRDAVATLDSAWHIGLVDQALLSDVFARLPRRYRRLRPLLDCRAESGPESLMRLLLRGLGCAVELQVDVDGVGRVDLLVDGWLIVECDSRAHHSGWDAQKRDRRRDLAAAARGYTTVRPIAEDILERPEVVLALLRQALTHPTARARRDRP